MHRCSFWWGGVGLCYVVLSYNRVNSLNEFAIHLDTLEVWTQFGYLKYFI
jgi:hypothetical protein